MRIFQSVALGEVKTLRIIEPIPMGEQEGSDLHEHVITDWLELKDGQVFLAADSVVTARIAENGWLEIRWEDGCDSVCDVALDGEEWYDYYFEAVEE